MRLQLQNLRTRYPLEVEEVLKSLYVEDIISAESTTAEVQGLKNTITSVCAKAKFIMHKWNSNNLQLGSENVVPVDEQQSCAKQGEIKMLGLPRNKREDLITITFPEEHVDVAKRGILQFLAVVYDPLGIASRTMLVGKLLYC